MDWEDVKAVYDKYYAAEKFVRVLDQDVCPETKWVEGSNYVDIGFKIDRRTGRIIMMGAIDNLVKGAAGKKPLSIAIDEFYQGKVKIVADTSAEEEAAVSADGADAAVQDPVSGENQTEESVSETTEE